MTSQRLYIKKDPNQCWVPKCKNKGQLFILICEDGVSESFVVLCEKHGEEALGAGQ